ncbi:MAG: tetratricopeptide repeat protein [Phaeodactylibacter sp.]|nr:tetratricopeptide repeat protein [Phaeodactylibacter sp.]MCB0614707.1 tetratricopeptide repeat protein [Phaeodactylibacter sp.]
MSEKKPIPVFFICFAQSEDQGYLEQLKLESSRIRDVLLRLDLDEKIKLFREESTQTIDLPRLLATFRNKIFIFHYAGHADGKHLHFEGRTGHAGGLAELLGLQKNLKLIFLNGCSTQEQARPYLEAGLPAVIATTRSIPDAEAAYIAECFYDALAHGYTIRESFRMASGALLARGYSFEPDNLVSYRGVGMQEAYTSEFPWRLYVNEQKAGALDWLIPEAPQMEREREAVVVLANSEAYQSIRKQIESFGEQLSEKNKQIEALPEPLPAVLEPIRQGLEKDRLNISTQMNEVKKRERQFKEEVLRLADSFSSTPINTQRLRRARTFFEQGKIQQADAILRTEEMLAEKEGLLASKARKEAELALLERQLADKASEFLIKAQLAALQKEKEGWFEAAIRAFEHSIEASTSFDNLFNYAEFLQEQKGLEKAEEIYQRILGLRFDTHQLARTRKQLGALYHDQYKYEEALQCYETALKMYQKLEKETPGKYEAEMARIQNNLGLLYLDSAHLKPENYLKLAEQAFRKAVRIQKKLAASNPRLYGPLLSRTENNLARLYQESGDFQKAENILQKVLRAYQKFSQDGPLKFESSLALANINLSWLYLTAGQHEKAEPYIRQALQIYQKLARTNPRRYNSDVAMAFANLGTYHFYSRQFEEAERNTREAIKVAPGEEWLQLNLANALLFQGRYLEAWKIYTALKNKPYEGKKTYRELILEDFQDIESKSLAHPDMEKIRTLLQEK